MRNPAVSWRSVNAEASSVLFTHPKVRVIHYCSVNDMILWCQSQDELKLACTHWDQILLLFETDRIQSNFWKFSISINRSIISSKGTQPEEKSSEDFGKLGYYHVLSNPSSAASP